MTPDVNVLMAASRSDHPHHLPARRWLEQALADAGRGATFALQEAVIALAVLLRRFRFAVTPETHPWPVQKLTTQPAEGLPMRVSKRRKP